MLTCVSVYITWFLVVVGPAPIVVGDVRGYQTQERCEHARFVLARTFSLYGDPLTFGR